MRRTNQEINASVGPIALYIRQRRRELGYTQERLAERIGVSKRFLRELELGKSTARMDKVNVVLAFFGAELTVSDKKSRESENA